MHPIKRTLLVVLFSLGTVGGFAHGFGSLGHCAARHEARREAFEHHVADLCTRSAERVYNARSGAEPAGATAIHDVAAAAE
jgi:hypothetical protein